MCYHIADVIKKPCEGAINMQVIAAKQGHSSILPVGINRAMDDFLIEISEVCVGRGMEAD